MSQARSKAAMATSRPGANQWSAYPQKNLSSPGAQPAAPSSLDLGANQLSSDVTLHHGGDGASAARGD